MTLETMTLSQRVQSTGGDGNVQPAVRRLHHYCLLANRHAAADQCLVSFLPPARQRIAHHDDHHDAPRALRPLPADLAGPPQDLVRQSSRHMVPLRHYDNLHPGLSPNLSFVAGRVKDWLTKNDHLETTGKTRFIEKTKFGLFFFVNLPNLLSSCLSMQRL